MPIKKNRPKIELRAAPSKDGAFVCRVDPALIADTLEVKGDWRYVRVKVDDRACIGWVKWKGGV